MVNDGSTDNSYQVCERLVKESKNIHLYTQKNKGVSAARNLGISVSRGKYILFVDADDSLPKNAIESYFIDGFESYDFIIGSYKAIGRGLTRKIIRKKAVYNNQYIKKFWYEFDQMISTPWAHLYKKSIIEKHNLKFDEGRPYSEDHIFNLRYCMWVKKCAVIQQFVYNYTLGGVASSVKYYPNMNKLGYDLLQEYLKCYCANSDFFFKRKISSHFKGCILHYISCCNNIDAKRKIGETLKLYNEYLSNAYVDEYNYTKAELSAIRSNDAAGLLRALKKENRKLICLRKVKRFVLNIKNKLWG